jgi:hypothetical protein
VNFLAALSKCQKLVRLDLSRLNRVSFHILDLLRAVSTLSCLKIFHFPEGCPTSSDSGLENKERSGKTPKWPDSLETFHIPLSLDMGHILAFEKLPTSLTSLIIDTSDRIRDEAIEVIFDLIGPQILTLKVEPETPSDGFASYLTKFPNLLHLKALPEIIAYDAMDYIDLQVDHPLRSITIGLDLCDDIFDPDFLDSLEDLVNIDRLPNIRRLLLNIDCLRYYCASFLREDPLPEEHIKLLDISKRLRGRSSSASGKKESGVLLVDSDDDDATVIEFTEEYLVKILSEAPPPEGTSTRRIGWN